MLTKQKSRANKFKRKLKALCKRNWNIDLTYRIKNINEVTRGWIIDYFKHTDRSNVQYFVSDMCVTYREIAENFFKRATFLVDKYHWIRQAVWAFEAVRKEEQKHLKADVCIIGRANQILAAA